MSEREDDHYVLECLRYAPHSIRALQKFRRGFKRNAALLCVLRLQSRQLITFDAETETCRIRSPE